MPSPAASADIHCHRTLQDQQQALHTDLEQLVSLSQLLSKVYSQITIDKVASVGVQHMGM